MKKVILFIFILILIVGCQQMFQEPVPSSAPTTESKSPEPAPEPEPEPVPEPLPEPEPVIPPKAPECYQDSDCSSNQICEDNECEDIKCSGYCKIISNHDCLELECCSDSDCDDENPQTEDECISPSKKDSHCSNILIEPSEPEDNSCIFDSECPDGKFCMSRSCLTIEEFYSQNIGCCEQGVIVTINEVDYSDCGFMATLTSNIEDCTQIPCPNCVQENQLCVAKPKHLIDLPFYNYCAECIIDSQCKQGYVCEDKKCIAS